MKDKKHMIISINATKAYSKTIYPIIIKPVSKNWGCSSVIEHLPRVNKTLHLTPHYYKSLNKNV